MQFSWKNTLKALPVLLLLAAGAAFGAAGNVQFVIGDVKLVTKAGETRALVKGAEINEGDRIITAAGASAQLKMVDGGFIAVRPNSNMSFDAYHYAGKEDGKENAVISLLQGGFRTITGIIGHTNKQNYLIRTETATIGIRGTDHEPMVILPPLPGQAPIAEPGTYDKVNLGVAFIRTDAGSVDIQRNQVGFAPITKAAPVILPRIPPFYKPTPAPGPQKAKEEAKDEGKKETAAGAPGKAGEEKKEAAPAAAAPAESAAETTAATRSTAVVDPTTVVTTAPAAAPVVTAPAVVAPVIAITATDASGTTLNTTTQTATTSTGTTTPITAGPVISSPAVTTGNYDYGAIGAIPITGGVEFISFGSQTGATTTPNTNFVLSNNNLVEIRQSPYMRFGLTTSTPTIISNADIKFTGGTAADTFSDPNGAYYIGRWTGGQIDVTDLSTTNPTAPFSDLLGTSSVHWLIGLTPGNLAGTSINNVQALTGKATYSLAAATHPTDGLGNVGTLNSASLTADFSAQTVDSSLALSFSSSDPTNVSKRNLSLTASASKMPIQKSGFGAAVIAPMVNGQPTSANNTINCSGADCPAGGYVGSIGGGFSGTASGAVGTGVGLTYGFTSNPASTSATGQPFADFITGAAVLSTTAAPTAGVINFASSAVLRDAAFWSTTQLAPGVNPAVTNYLASDKTNETLTNNLGGTATTPVTISGPTANTNFLFDASGNLLRIYDTPHVVFDHGNDVVGSSTQFAAPTPLAHAQLTFSGGTASENYYDPTTSVRFGRWTGGAVDVTDLSTGANYIESLTAPGGAARSVQWVVAQTPSSLPTTGEFHYTRINGASGTPSFATAPTDSYGNVGTLEGARLSADFTNMRASAGVRISIPSGPGGSLGVQNLSAHFENAPISGGGFNVSTGTDNPAGTDNLHVSCFGAGCAPDISTGVSAYGGRIRGAFDSATGNAGTANGAFLAYVFNTLYGAYGATPPAGRVVDDYVNGLVAFQQGPQILMPTVANAYSSVTAPTGPIAALTAYSFNSGGSFYTTADHYWVDQPSATNPATGKPNLVTDASGNLSSIAEGSNQQHGNDGFLTLSGGTANPATPLKLAIGSATSATDGTILLGWQQASPTLTLTGSSGSNGLGCFDGSTGCPARTVNADGLSWVRGPTPFPDYLPSAISGYSNSGGVVVSGTANYTLGSSIMHDQTGTAGSVGTASLGVNFSRQFVNFSMTATTPTTGTWSATANGIRMNESGSFNAYTPPPTSGTGAWTVVTAPQSPTGNINTHDSVLSVTNTSLTNTFGNISGQLMGIGLGGAGVTFAMNGSPTGCSGSTCVQSVTGALGFTIGGTGPFTTSASQPYSTSTAYQLAAFTTPMVNLSGLNSTQLGQLSSSDLTDLSTGIRGGFVSPYRTQVVNNFPVQVDGQFPVVVSQTPPAGCTGCIGNTYVNSIPAVYSVTGATGAASIGTAKLLESGFDATTGIRWGRYGAGTIGITDRITTASLGTVDLTSQSSHFVLSTVQSGPTVLPLTGTFNYTFAGGTTPTDSNGNVGTALTAANVSLAANFATQKVDFALSNIVVGGNTWGASATAIPISGNFFGADKKLDGTGNLTVTSTLGTKTAGSVGGVFTGPTGGGAAMLYSLNYGGNISTNPAAVTVSGAAAFKR